MHIYLILTPTFSGILPLKKLNFINFKGKIDLTIDFTLLTLIKEDCKHVNPLKTRFQGSTLKLINSIWYFNEVIGLIKKNYI